MKLLRRETMSWLWLDPLRHLHHRIYKDVFSMLMGQRRVVYTTYCGHNVTVDDVNSKTKVMGIPSCFRCVIADEIADVVDGYV